MNWSPQKSQGKLIGVFLGLLFGLPLTSFGAPNPIETPKPVSGHAVSLKAITPADVFARVQLLRKELDDIRFEMGKPKSQEVGLLVEGAAPHEVFFQAKTLDQKVAQLTLELTGKPQGKEQKWNPGEIHPLHVWKMVDTALLRLLLLKQELELTLTNSEALPDPTTTPTQVFLEIGLAIKQLNHPRCILSG